MPMSATATAYYAAHTQAQHEHGAMNPARLWPRQAAPAVRRAHKMHLLHEYEVTARDGFPLRIVYIRYAPTPGPAARTSSTSTRSPPRTRPCCKQPAKPACTTTKRPSLPGQFREGRPLFCVPGGSAGPTTDGLHAHQEFQRLVLVAVAPYVDQAVLRDQIAEEERQRRQLRAFAGGWPLNRSAVQPGHGTALRPPERRDQRLDERPDPLQRTRSSTRLRSRPRGGPWEPAAAPTNNDEDRRSHLARDSRCCRPYGFASPACSASVQQFLRGSSDSSPSTNARARRRGSTRANRPAIRPIRTSNVSCQRAGSTL